MKKLVILSIAIAAISLATPGISQATLTGNRVAFSQDKEVKYTEIKAEQLPAAVATAVAKDYSGFSIDQAFKGNDGSFKVLVSNGSTKHVLFYGADGNLLKTEQPGMKSEVPRKK